jgi:hypothetical protein
MRIWIEYNDGRVKEFDVDDLHDAQYKFQEEKGKDWDFFSFRGPPRAVEPKQEFKYLPM